MKRFIVASVCTLGLTLLGAFGNYQNSSALANGLNAVNGTTRVEQNVTNSISQQSLPVATTAVKGASVVITDKNEIKAVKTSSDKKDKVKKDKKKTGKKNNKKAKSKKNNSAVKGASTQDLTYKNIDLSKCKSVKEVVIKLQQNGCKNINASNIKNIKGLEDVLAYVKQNGSQQAPTTKPTPTTKPAPTTKPTPTTQPSPTQNPSDLNSYASQVLKLVNQERAKAGLSALTTNSTLSAAANKRAKETSQSFSHTRPDGTSFSTVLKEYNIAYRAAGENIAYGQKTPQEVVTGWMNSPGHRANILNSNYGKLGIGVYKSNGVIYWSQLFTN